MDKSVELSGLLKRRGIKHELLNALPEHAAREADIVAQAGRIGSVTISTNMAGRGTDIILGGNPETMAWSKLRNRFASRLDVPEAEWKALIDEIEAKEKTKEEGRKVAAMGGLHIVGSERHEARRIDNQLRGRAGRQGDPGSSRFFLSLEDDLMRIFAGEWVRSLLEKLGMTEGQAIESRMVSRRIGAAQKKVEEHNFDSRKSLLEYDEVMDFQRKEVYSRRQRLLEGTNAKVQILDMFDKQVAGAVKRFLATGLRRGHLRRVRLEPAVGPVQAERVRPHRLRGGRALRPREGDPGHRGQHPRRHRGEHRVGGRDRVELAGAGARGQHALRPQDDRPPAQADRPGRPQRIPDGRGPEDGRSGGPRATASRTSRTTGGCARCATGRGCNTASR